MKKLMIGVPCCNDADCVRKTLAPVIDEYRENGVDVYYYDSSENNEIRDIVYSYRSKGYENVYHIPFDTPVVNQKIEMIFSGYGLKDEYEYYWPLKTYSCIAPGLLKNLMKELEGNYDAVYLDVLGALPHTVVMEDITEFYNIFAWSATSIDVTIYRKDTLLSGFVFSEEMLHSTKSTMPSFPHWYTLFSELAKLENPRILAVNRDEVVLAGVIRNELRYVDTIFDIWKDDWIRANDALPEIYAPYKEKVLKEAAGKPHLIAYIPRLITLHEKGVLTQDNLEKVLNNWERISDIPKDTVAQIANGTWCPTNHSADRLQYDGYDNEIEVFSKVFDLFSKGALPLEDLPINDMSTLLDERVREVFRKKEKYYSEFLSKGTVQDLKEYLQNPSRTKQEIMNAIQLMSLMLALARLAWGDEGL